MTSVSVTIALTFPEDHELRRLIVAAIGDRLSAVDIEKIDGGTPSTEPKTDSGFAGHLRDASDRTRRFWSILGKRAGSSVPIDDISDQLGLQMKQTPGLLAVIARSLRGRGLERFGWEWDKNNRTLTIKAEVGPLVLQALREIGFEA